MLTINHSLMKNYKYFKIYILIMIVFGLTFMSCRKCKDCAYYDSHGTVIIEGEYCGADLKAVENDPNYKCH